MGIGLYSDGVRHTAGKEEIENTPAGRIPAYQIFEIAGFIPAAGQGIFSVS
jgi:hypothetical protein